MIAEGRLKIRRAVDNVLADGHGAVTDERQTEIVALMRTFKPAIPDLPVGKLCPDQVIVFSIVRPHEQIIKRSMTAEVEKVFLIAVVIQDRRFHSVALEGLIIFEVNRIYFRI